jgi:hypothetical protein
MMKIYVKQKVETMKVRKRDVSESGPMEVVMRSIPGLGLFKDL